MYSSTFIFAKRQYGEEFFRLDEAVAEAARQIPGYLGEETWENPTNGLISNAYYCTSLEVLQTLMMHPKHVEAKRAQGKWLSGYQVIVSEVIRTYSDGKISHAAGAFAAANASLDSVATIGPA